MSVKTPEIGKKYKEVGKRTIWTLVGFTSKKILLKTKNVDAKFTVKDGCNPKEVFKKNFTEVK